MVYSVKQGDELDPFIATVKVGGALEDFTSRSGLRILFYSGGALVLTVTEPTTGLVVTDGKVASQVKYTWQAGDTELFSVGDATAEIIATYTEGEKTYPTSGFIQFKIVARGP